MPKRHIVHLVATKPMTADREYAAGDVLAVLESEIPFPMLTYLVTTGKASSRTIGDDAAADQCNNGDTSE